MHAHTAHTHTYTRTHTKATLQFNQSVKASGFILFFIIWDPDRCSCYFSDHVICHDSTHRSTSRVFIVVVQAVLSNLAKFWSWSLETRRMKKRNVRLWSKPQWRGRSKTNECCQRLGGKKKSNVISMLFSVPSGPSKTPTSLSYDRLTEEREQRTAQG